MPGPMAQAGYGYSEPHLPPRSTAQEDRELQSTVPPKNLLSGTLHRQAIDTHLPAPHATWMKDVTQGPTSHVANVGTRDMELET